MDKIIKILVVEDEISIFETIEFSLKKEKFNACHAKNGQQALTFLDKNDFALVILDIGLPDLDGFEVCKEIRKKSNVPIIFLTARGEEIEKILGLELGADDYLTKPFSPRELAARVKSILRRSSRIEHVENNALWKVDLERIQISYQGNIIDLSTYEFRLMEVLLKRPGKVFSRGELMDRAWENPDMSMERTIDAHIKSIRAKLKKISAEELIITHRGFGYSIKE